jgi:hypothetical protein
MKRALAPNRPLKPAAEHCPQAHSRPGALEGGACSSLSNSGLPLSPGAPGKAKPTHPNTVPLPTRPKPESPPRR